MAAKFSILLGCCLVAFVSTGSGISTVYLKNNGSKTADIWINGAYQGCLSAGNVRFSLREGFTSRDSGLQPDGTVKRDVVQGGWNDADPLEVVAVWTGTDDKESRSTTSIPEESATEAYVWFGDREPGAKIQPSQLEFAGKISPCQASTNFKEKDEAKRREIEDLKDTAEELKKTIRETKEKISSSITEQLQASQNAGDSAAELRAKIAEEMKDFAEYLQKEMEAEREELLEHEKNLGEEYKEELNTRIAYLQGAVATLKRGSLPAIDKSDDIMAQQRDTLSITYAWEIDNHQRQLADLKQGTASVEGSTIGESRDQLRHQLVSLDKQLDNVTQQLEELTASANNSDFAVGNTGERQGALNHETEKRSLLDGLGSPASTNIPPTGNSLLDVLGEGK